jgi:tRNA modification GTPase
MMSEMDDLIQSFECGRIAKEGVNILILGRPNVGKSSLLNSLLGEARAIVTDIPGTTRDTIEEDLVLGGLPLRLVDTAGIRHTEDPVEAEGVRRARSKIEGADLVLLVVDGSMSLDNDDLLAIDACRHKDVLVVLNKADLGSLPFPDCLGQFPVVKISALQGLGLTDLVDKISQHFTFRPEVSEARETVILTEFRHKQALMAARDSLGRFRESLVQGMSPEFSAVEIGEALDRVGEITGETTPDDVLDRIFTKFCIGK